MMSLAGGQAPDGLWDRIADEIGPDAPIGAVPQLRLVPVDEKPKTTRRWWGVALGSVAAAAIAVLGLTVVHQGSRIDDLEAVTSKDAVVVGAAEAMTDPNARLTSLTTTDGATMADVVVQPNGQGYLVPRSMPTLASDRTYQMWGVIGDEVISLGVLGNEPSVSAFHTDPRVKTIMITDEVRGGVPVTQQTPVSQGELRLAVKAATPAESMYSSMRVTRPPSTARRCRPASRPPSPFGAMPLPTCCCTNPPSKDGAAHVFVVPALDVVDHPAQHDEVLRRRDCSTSSVLCHTTASGA